MTVDQVIDTLKLEKQQRVPSRIPCRAIMVGNIAEYCDLLEKLKTIPNVEVVPSDVLFSSADVLPAYDSLMDSQYKDKWLILPGVSEYLRLFSRGETQRQRFTKLWRYMGYGSDLGRIIIPLWGCSAQWHDKDLHLDGDERQKDFFFDCTTDISDPQTLKILVLSKQFDKYQNTLVNAANKVFSGIRSWYEYWSNPSVQYSEYVLITGRLRDVQSTAGDISVHVLPDTLSFIRAYLQGGEVLTSENCPDESVNLLFPYALQKGNLDEAILNCLNLVHFQNTDVMGKWATMNNGQKQLAMLWMQLHQQDDYLSYCVRKAKNANDLVDNIYHDIFSLRLRHPEWEKESQELMSALNLSKDPAFFKALDEIPDYKLRLCYLTGNTQAERIYLIHMIGEWLRMDAQQALSCSEVQSAYPELYAYLQHTELFKDSDSERYFDSYKSYKLSNRLPQDEDIYFSNFDINSYPYRYTLLSDSITTDSVILWIDALGAEWLSLLCWTLQKDNNGQIKSVALAQSCLPTETEYNDQWNKMDTPHDKLDKLDKLAHHGVIDDPSYYACIQEQFSFFSKVVDKVEELFQKYHRVIITGDHGSSRLAARFFHAREGYPAPASSQVCSHGRFCIFNGAKIIASSNQVIAKDSDGNQYLIFKNYDHFKQSGFAAGGDDENAQYGELHGGASPEELLVPVVVFDSIHELPLTATWKKDSIKFSMKKAKPVILFNKPVQNVQASLGSVDGICTPIDTVGKEWMIVFSENKAEATKNFKYDPIIIADGKVVHVPSLEIKPALGGGDFDL